MNPILKQHIESCIDDIERGELTNSIMYCPLDVISDYLDILRMIDEVIPGHLIPYTRISCCLASFLKGGNMCDATLRSVGDETYEFKFPVCNIDFVLLRQELNNCCPYHYVTVDLATDYMNGLLSVKVSIHNVSKFMF